MNLTTKRIDDARMGSCGADLMPCDLDDAFSRSQVVRAIEPTRVFSVMPHPVAPWGLIAAFATAVSCLVLLLTIALRGGFDLG